VDWDGVRTAAPLYGRSPTKLTDQTPAKSGLLIAGTMKRAAIYLRVSTIDQTTANQEQALREAAERSGLKIVKVYRDHGISGAKGRDKRPGFDALCRDATSGNSTW
jgi:hypothetical protein